MVTFDEFESRVWSAVGQGNFSLDELHDIYDRLTKPPWIPVSSGELPPADPDAPSTSIDCWVTESDGDLTEDWYDFDNGEWFRCNVVAWMPKSAWKLTPYEGE